MSRFICIVIFNLLIFNSFAQKFIYDLNFLFYFDNREYHNPYSMPQSLLGVRLSPEMGLQFAEKDSTLHQIRAGIHYIQPIGNEYKDLKVLPTVYYRYEGKKFTFNFGTVPFRHMYEPLPDYLLYDSTSYFYPNIQGALLQHRSKYGEIELQLDWRGLQSKETREAFRVILNGRYQYKFFYMGGYVALNHLANQLDSEPKKGVCDDIMINPLIGFDLAKKTPFSKLHFQLGYIATYQRMRIAHTDYFQQGIRFEAEVKWRFLGVKNAFYIGNNLQPYFPTVGHELYLEDPDYQSNLYNRTDLYIYLIERDFVKCYFSWNFHYLHGYKLGHQQQLLLYFDLGKIPKRKKNKKNIEN